MQNLQKIKEDFFQNENDLNTDNINDSEYINEDEFLNNYKGHYFNDESEEKYYEGGAHFKYKELYNRLENLLKNSGTENQGEDKNFQLATEINYNSNDINSNIREYSNDIPHVANKNKKLFTEKQILSIDGNKEKLSNNVNETKRTSYLNSNIQQSSFRKEKACNLIIPKNVYKELRSLRDKTNFMDKYVNLALEKKNQISKNFNVLSGNSSSKNSIKRENTLSINNKVEVDCNDILPNHNSENQTNIQRNFIYKKLKPEKIVHKNTSTAIIKNKNKLICINKKIPEKKVNNTRIQNSKLNMNSTFYKANNVVYRFLNNSIINNNLNNGQPNDKISKTSHIINELNNISSLTKSRNMSINKQTDSNAKANIANNLKITLVKMNNKLTYSDTKTSAILQQFKETNRNPNKIGVKKDTQNVNHKENNRRLINQLNVGIKNTTLSLTNEEINNNNSNSSSCLINAFNVNFKTITNNKSRNTQRNLPDKTHKSKNHTTSDNKTAFIHSNDCIINKYSSSTMKNESSNLLNNMANIEMKMKTIVDNKIELNKNDIISIQYCENNKNELDEEIVKTPTKPKVINEKLFTGTILGLPIKNKNDTRYNNNNNRTNSIKNLPQFLIKNSSITTSAQLNNINDSNKRNSSNFSSLNQNQSKKVLLNYKDFNKYLFNKKDQKSNSRTLKFLFLNNQTNKKELSFSKEVNSSNTNLMRENSLSKEKNLIYSQNCQFTSNTKNTYTSSRMINLSNKTPSNLNSNTNTNIYSSSGNDSKGSFIVNPNNSKNKNANSYYNTNNNSNNIIHFNSSSNNSLNVGPGNNSVIPNLNLNLLMSKSSKYKIVSRSESNNRNINS